MLALTCERAGIRDGDRVLELGCGWGSLTLWMAEKFPRCAITAVSNSRPQREFILSRARAMGLREPTVITADANVFDTPDRFERIVSVEMFEHMKNYRALMSRVASWLTPGGRLFVHVFAHATLAYHFETDDWMGRYFFTGGTMPSHDLLPRFAGELRTAGQWAIDGTHYAKTARAWLDNLDARRDRALGVLARAYGEHAPRWLHRWRVFFMACEELWNFRGGKEWIVSHSVFDKPG
jgi:cyclopropane-fatty-acyl-phospholipid synthase